MDRGQDGSTGRRMGISFRGAGDSIGTQPIQQYGQENNLWAPQVGRCLFNAQDTTCSRSACLERPRLLEPKTVQGSIFLDLYSFQNLELVGHEPSLFLCSSQFLVRQTSGVLLSTDHLQIIPMWKASRNSRFQQRHPQSLCHGCRGRRRATDASSHAIGAQV